MEPIVTLTTDFGTSDGYVGVMKGVILSIAPHVCLIDITHAIPPQNVVQAAFTLFNAAPFFPDGTVHLVVVDPGVGTKRRPLAIQAGGKCYVGPDNGVFSLVAGTAGRAVVLENSAYYRAGSYVSNTFHGRDIFAPVAAHLAAGVPLEEFGRPVEDWNTLPIPAPLHRPPDEWEGEVLYLDHFGNAVTNIGVLEWVGGALQLMLVFGSDDRPRLMSREAQVGWRERAFPLRRTYAEVHLVVGGKRGA